MRTARRYFGLCVLVSLLVFQPRSQASHDVVFWPSDALTKIMRSDEPAPGVANVLVLSGARGETVSSQAVFRPAQDMAAPSVSIGDLRHVKVDASIPNAAIRLQWVRYIDIDRNTSGIPEDELVVKAPASIPDPFWERPAIHLRAQQAQPAWIEIHIPKETKPGDYEGKLTVTASRSKTSAPAGIFLLRISCRTTGRQSRLPSSTTARNARPRERSS
ncbi:MAG: hypothetical protein A2Z25_03370 [Planctomycetes bacterium RBG_16_55_9]|nr:MAG: hypothetical protein A2Z25_03370 [Planctomycetes bacterium RBG_16_55_9]